MIYASLRTSRSMMDDIATVPFFTDGSKDLLGNLYHALNILSTQNLPPMMNPEGCKKRASVACIIRLKPNYNGPYQFKSTSVPGRSVSEKLRLHFNQDWVQQSDPEILFIRRAARDGDRWTSQVALPGGKRDAEDADDLATSTRETKEEVGLDLNSDQALLVGKLPDRVITTEWGSTPLMVLCPFVYLITEPSAPKLNPQPDEIASTHWVPIRALLSPSSWTYESADASDRFARQGGQWLKLVFRAMVGRMLFGAIRLKPSESQVPASMMLENSIHRQEQSARPGMSASQLSPTSNDSGVSKPLLLWGLTHGIVIDLLRLIPNSRILHSWRWPTFSAYDIRIAIWLISRSFRYQKMYGLHDSPEGPFFVIEEGFASRDKGSGSEANDYKHDARKRSAALELCRPASSGDMIHDGSYSVVHYMLQGYFQHVQKAILLAMTLRVGFAAALLALAFKGRACG